MAPTTCVEDSEAKFFLKTVDHNPIQPVYQTCSWLQSRGAKDQICKSLHSWEGANGSPAREVCHNTCNTCPTEISITEENPRGGSGPQSVISTSDGKNLPTMGAFVVALMAVVAMSI